jgi:hypothetical protein
MNDISSKLQSLIGQSISDQAAKDAEAENRLAEQRRQQQISDIVNKTDCFTPQKMIADLGRDPTPEEFYNKWTDMWIDCLEALKTFGIDSIPDNWTEISDAPSLEYAICIFRLAFDGERDKLVKALTEVGTSKNEIQKDLRINTTLVFRDLIEQHGPIEQREDDQYREFPDPPEVDYATDLPTQTNDPVLAKDDSSNDQSSESSVEERALQLLVVRNDLNKKQIAKEIDCTRRSLAKGRCPKLHEAMEAYKHRDLPSGSKSADGGLEAWDDIEG